MNSTYSSIPASSVPELAATPSRGVVLLAQSVSWPAILAGLTAALALQVLFMMLGAGLGFALYNPLTDGTTVADLGKGAMVVQGVSAVLSLWFGGWVAGRFTPQAQRATAWLQGFIVWCAATVAGVLIVSGGAGWALGDLSKMVGGGLSMAGKPAAAIAGGVTDLAKDALKQSGDTVSSFIEEATSRRPANTPPTEMIQSKREIGLALMRFFNPAQGAVETNNRAAAVKALVEFGGMNEADADRALTTWTTSYERLKADLDKVKVAAETKARDAAEKAANTMAILSLCAFAGFVLGAIAGICGGKQGASAAFACEARGEDL